MSFFQKMVGKKQDSLSPQEAIQKLRELEDLLAKKQEYLESKINTEFQIAKTNASKNKQLAMQALKRKKRFEKQLQQVDNTLTTIEIQREGLEVANTNVTVLKTMKNTANTLKKAHHDVDIDNIHSMMDELADQQELANDIANAISSPIGFGLEVDEDELEKELEDLEEEILEEKLLQVPFPQVLPEVPRDRVAGSSKSDDDLSKLEQWAS